MAFITQFYTWATGNTITAVRLNGNISNLIDGLSAGTKDINISKLQIGGTDVIDSSQNITITGDITGTSGTSTKPTWMIKNTNADANSGELQFYKLSASPADSDNVGKISFYGDDDGTNKTLYGQILATSTDVTDATEDGKIDFYSMMAGTSTLTFSTESGVLKIPVDGTAENAAGSLTLGAGNDAGLFFDGTDLVIITNGAGASGIILDSEDDTVEIKGSGTLQATFDTGGLDLVTGDEYSINSTSVLNATTLGSAVVASSLTSVGTLTSLTMGGTITDNATSGITASTTQSQGQGALTAVLNEIANCANEDDVNTLPTGSVGDYCYVNHNGDERLQLYPPSGYDLGKGANASMKVVTGSRLTFRLDATSTWSLMNSYSTVQNTIRLSTGAGYGSTNTMIRRMETSVEASGKAIVAAHSATLGTTLTIQEDGVYAMTYNDAQSAAQGAMGISLNSTQLTTSIQNITSADELTQSHMFVADESVSISATMPLSTGDIIRMHTTSHPNSTDAHASRFIITKVN